MRLLFYLLLFSCLSSCQLLKQNLFRASSRSDSTHLSSSDNQTLLRSDSDDLYEKKTIQEYAPPDPSLAMPSVAPQLLRVTTYEKGRSRKTEQVKTRAKKQEETMVTTQEKTTERDYSPMIESALLLSKIFLVMLALALLLLVWAVWYRKR